MLQYFKGSLLFTLVCLALAVVYGWTRFGTLAGTAELTWIVLVLAAIMLLSARFHIPETFTGLVGGGLIAASLAWSVRWRRRHPRP